MPFRKSAQDLTNALLSDGDYHVIADDMLDQIATVHSYSIEDLKVRLDDYFDIICSELQIRGIKLKMKNLQEEIFQILNKAHYWSEPSAWLHTTLDKIALNHNNVRRQELINKLETAREYIDENLCNPNLSVSEIGEAVV